MLQPFESFKQIYIERLLQLKKRYLVSQTYMRKFEHFDTGEEINLLLSDYEDRVIAKTHWDALKNDPFRAILDLQNTEHILKLQEMLSEGSKYRLFWAVVRDAKDLEKRINTKLPDNLKRYIEKNTNWRIGRDKIIRPSLQLIFGELFIILKYAGQTLRVKLEDIENA
ncbi:MAG TPA: hypothetical protein PK339_12370 [Flavitalea sp.]|nr:hypothetical protein [Flavitalea sp.]